ncbi:MAG: ABC transporter permease [Acidobacteria bacterium]|nr:ABC transporter permease [Bryobacteraceae bacterium CoA2 C42]MCA2962711.1 ABC transporter permease [Acidobacteriaceae bacterium]
MLSFRQKLFTAIGLAASSLRAHKLRTFLTLLGIIIGVTSVVLVGAAIEGLGNYAEVTTSKAFGSETYLIAQIANVGRLTRKERAEKLRVNKQIRGDDLDYLRLTTGNQILYAPYRTRVEDIKRAETTYEGAAILGTAAVLPSIRDVVLTDGRFFTDQEERTRQFVCVIGDEVREKLFPGVSPIGGKITVRGYEFTVLGVQEKLGNAGGRAQDNSVYIPSPVFTRIIGPATNITIFAKPRPETGLTLDESLDITRMALRTRFRTRPGQADNFDFLTPDSIRAFIDQVLGLIKVVVVPVTMISLVVGGIVIMNIMLVSVTERTREIGVRKSLGARKSDILLQFLVESLMMSLVGGLVGLGLAYVLAEGLSVAFNAPLEITGAYIFLAIFVSSAVGVISGWYPAAKAASLDPVEALRAD